MNKKFAIAAFVGTALLPLAVQAAGFSLDSPDLKAGQPIPEAYVFKGFGCDGGNVSPALAWKNPPKDTKSFAVTVYDPDAPTGSGWWHWVLFNLPADTSALPQGAGDPAAAKAPKGAVQSRTDFGKPGWGGPCPPKGDKPHRYIFTVHALKVDKIDADENAPAAMVGFMLNANSLGKASFTAKYGRQ
jgi:Raf kinase inhibitor-like YbhB/YbcL family protein